MSFKTFKTFRSLEGEEMGSNGFFCRTILTFVSFNSFYFIASTRFVVFISSIDDFTCGVLLPSNLMKSSNLGKLSQFITYLFSYSLGFSSSQFWKFFFNLTIFCVDFAICMLVGVKANGFFGVFSTVKLVPFWRDFGTVFSFYRSIKSFYEQHLLLLTAEWEFSRNYLRPYSSFSFLRLDLFEYFLICRQICYGILPGLAFGIDPTLYP